MNDLTKLGKDYWNQMGRFTFLWSISEWQTCKNCYPQTSKLLEWNGSGCHSSL